MISSLRILCLLFCNMLMVVAGYGVDFAPRSQLADGRWVKIKVGDSGLYAVSYSELRDMGFSSPERVGVYGKGGEVMSLSFTDPVSGHPYYDDLRQISVIHSGDSLVFYGEGVDKVSWDKEEQRFMRMSKNIYSDYGVYFLSDKSNPVLAGYMIEGASDSEPMERGLDFVFHEKDLCHNVTRTGQQFWGEEFKDTGGSIKWTVPAKLAVAGNATLEYEFVLEPSLSDRIPYSIDMYLEESGEYYSSTYTTRLSDAFTPRNYHHKFNVRPKGEFNINLGVRAEDSGFTKLNHWLLTYPKRFPASSNELTVPERYLVCSGDDGGYSLSIPGDVRIVDITEPEQIRISPVSDSVSSITARCFRAEGNDCRELVLYGVGSELKRISGWQTVENADLHGIDVGNVSLAIITVPQFVTYAHRIAELHRKYDGIETIVAATENVYNEFSGGVPDPMAYRAFMKMIYDKGNGKLRNLLLLGPSVADIRILRGRGDMEYLLAFQEPEATSEHAAASVYDLYGILSDNINPARLNRENMDIGVGLLSCFDDKDCLRALRKIKRYMESEDRFAWYLNETLQIGGLHNKHAHDRHAVNYGALLNSLSPSPIASYTLCVDAFGNKSAKERFIAELGRGKLMTTYFGHGSLRFMGVDGDFFTSSDVPLLKNSFPGFAFLGGCDFSYPDNRVRGLGECLVLDTENGMTGALISCRESMSNVNYELAKRIASVWLEREYGSPSPTIGEVYAKIKSNFPYRNSLNYFYSGDPAVTFPVATQRISASFACDIIPGRKVNVKGKIEDSRRETDTGFNGTLVLKLSKPVVTLTSMDYVTGTCRDVSEPDTLQVEYRADNLLSFETEVKNGEFSMDIILPGNTVQYEGQLLPVYLSAYDADLRSGAVGYLEALMESPDRASEDMAAQDKEAPGSEVSYDHLSGRIEARCSDDAGLYATPLAVRATLDGQNVILESSGFNDEKRVVKTADYHYNAWSLSSGSHIFEIEVSDISGNSSYLKYEFDVPEEDGSLGLGLSSKAVVDRLDIEIDNTVEAMLIIRDSEGDVIFSRDITGAYTWNCINNDGETVAPGLYRICVVEKGEGVHKRFSGWRDIAVLK